jgi:hypothetical protein
MAKEKSSKTNVSARMAEKAIQAKCKFCGNKIETVMRLPAQGKRQMVRVCCERAQAA